jgi:hypothetical protein
MTEAITQLPIDECKDWILHALDVKDQYCTIRYAVYNKWEFIIVNSNISFECFPDVNILIRIKSTIGMNLIKTTISDGSFAGEIMVWQANRAKEVTTMDNELDQFGYIPQIQRKPKLK